MKSLSNALRASSRKSQEISNLTGISVARLGDLESGSIPSMSELRAVADVLGLRLDDFRAPTEQMNRAEMLFRDAIMSGVPIGDEVISPLSRRIYESLSLIIRAGLGEEILHNIPMWSGKFQTGVDSAEENAAAYRRVFFEDDQICPLYSLPEIVEEKMKVVLLVSRFNSIDGSSGYMDGMPFIFLSPRFLPRMLYTLAHEVGHLILHHDSKKSAVVIDQDVHSPRPTADGRTHMEKEANAFASALLMPATGVGIALKTIRNMVSSGASENLGDLEISCLSRIFGVSFWAASIRCEQLNLLPKGGAYGLYKEVCRLYKSPEKRAEMANLPPRPEIRFPTVPIFLLKEAVRRIESGEISIGRAAEMLSMPIGDIIEMHGEIV